jgi:hypothetical protein
MKAAKVKPHRVNTSCSFVTLVVKEFPTVYVRSASFFLRHSSQIP